MTESNILVVLSDNDLIDVLQRLHPLDALSFGATCRRVRNLVKSNDLWRDMFSPYAVPEFHRANLYEGVLHILREMKEERTRPILQGPAMEQSIEVCARNETRGHFVVILPCAAFSVVHVDSENLYWQFSPSYGAVPGCTILELRSVCWMHVEGTFTSLDPGSYIACVYLRLEQLVEPVLPTVLDVLAGNDSMDYRARSLGSFTPIQDIANLNLIGGWVRVTISGIEILSEENTCSLRFRETSNLWKAFLSFGRFELYKQLCNEQQQSTLAMQISPFVASASLF